MKELPPLDGRSEPAIPARLIGATGMQVSVLGFGGLQIGDYWVRMSEEDAYHSVRMAFEAGVTYFDTAPQYGNGLSEHRLGHALRGLPRDRFVVSTKVGRYLVPEDDAVVADSRFRGLPFRKVYDLSYDATMRGFEQSLHRLGMSRIDLLFIHDLDPHQLGDSYEQKFREGVEGCYRALEELRAQKMIRGIGAGLNDAGAAIRLIEATDLDCLMIAGRYTLLEQGPAADLLPLAARRNVSLIVGAPFNTGILATGAVENARYNNRPAPPNILEKVRRMQAVCDAFAIPIAAVALQFPLGGPMISAVVPGMGGRADVERNLRLMRTPVPEALWLEMQRAGLLAETVPTSASPMTS